TLVLLALPAMVASREPVARATWRSGLPRSLPEDAHQPAHGPYGEGIPEQDAQQEEKHEHVERRQQHQAERGPKHGKRRHATADPNGQEDADDPQPLTD